MTVMERFSEVLKALKAQPYKESNVNPIDVTALAYGLVPMSVYRKLDTKGEDGDSVTCDLYLDNIFIASGKVVVYMHQSFAIPVHSLSGKQGYSLAEEDWAHFQGEVTVL